MREIFLPGVVMLGVVAGLGADVVDDDLQVHLSLSTETLDVGQEVTLVGADRAAQRVVVLKCGPETEWKNRGTVKAAGNHSCMVAGSGLGIGSDQAASVFMKMLGDDNGKIGSGKEEDLVSKKAGDPREGHRATVTG